MTTAQAADAAARLSVILRDIVSFFDAAGCGKASVEKLEAKIDSHDFVDFLELAEAYSKCMAFIDHDHLAARLLAAWNATEEGLVIEKKIVSRKIRLLESDKNADPDILAKLQNTKMDVDQRKAKVLIQCMKYKLITSHPIEKFYDKTYDPIEQKKKAAAAALAAAAAETTA